MTDSPNRKHLSRRVVVASYAISVTVFLGICMIGAAITLGNPWYGLLAPIFPFVTFLQELACVMQTPSTDTRALHAILLLLNLCPILLQILGLSGFVISLRRPDRWGWFVRGHAYLAVYYVLCLLFSLVSVLLAGMP